MEAIAWDVAARLPDGVAHEFFDGVMSLCRADEPPLVAWIEDTYLNYLADDGSFHQVADLNHPDSIDEFESFLKANGVVLEEVDDG